METFLSDANRNDVLGKLVRAPGGPALLGVCTRLQLQVAAQASASGGFLDACIQHMESASSDVRIASLEALIGDDGIAALQRAALHAPQKLTSFIQKLHSTVQNESEGIWHRVHSADVLHEIASRTDVQGASWLERAFANSALVIEASNIARIVSSTVCVPLREALLPYFSDLCKLIVARPALSSNAAGVLQPWSNAVTKCADEYASVQSREAACAALRVLGQLLFPSSSGGKLEVDGTTAKALFEARIAAIDLLTDDDEDVRVEAAAMIGETVSAAVIVAAESKDSVNSGGKMSQREAMQQVARRGGASPDVSTDRAWSWMAAFYSKNAKNAPKGDNAWSKYVLQQLIPAPSAMGAMFEEALATNTLLFAEEKPNQFRDPEATLRRAAKFVQLQDLKPDERTDVEKRTNESLERLDKAVQNGNSKHDAIAMHMLAMRLLLTHQILSNADAAANKAAESIASALGIEVASEATFHALEESNTDPKDAKTGAAQPRYNIA